ncbi:MAG: OmpA family protein [Bdellovibrionales bacterium]|nr:OmpA family protein [Ramlibacter sp.]
MAQDDSSFWYGGINAGRTRADIDDARIKANLAAGGYATTAFSESDRSTGFKLYGGYQLNRNFALEGGYFDLGRFSYRANTLPLGTLDGRIRLRGLNLDAVGILPLGDRFSAFGRVGAAYAQARDNFSGTGAVSVVNPNPRKNDLNFKIGAGLGYMVTDALQLRLEAERYRVNDAVGNRGDVDLLSVGLVYRFGGKTQQPVMARTAAYEPPPAPAPAPAPVIVAAPPPPPPVIARAATPMRVSFAADSLFDFDKSVIKPDGAASLDRFGQDLRAVSYDGVAVTGHTDRIGSRAYNLKLSQRRAEAVNSYLVQKAGVPAGKINSRGVNGDNPVTKPGDCPGKKVTPALIACLQPDRRVDVEVTGTK